MPPPAHPRMARRVLTLAAAAGAAAVVSALGAGSQHAVVVRVAPGVLACVRAMLRTLRATRESRPEAIVSVAPPAVAHLIARLVRRGRSWTAYVAEPIRFVRDDRW